MSYFAIAFHDDTNKEDQCEILKKFHFKVYFTYEKDGYIFYQIQPRGSIYDWNYSLIPGKYGEFYVKTDWGNSSGKVKDVIANMQTITHYTSSTSGKIDIETNKYAQYIYNKIKNLPEQMKINYYKSKEISDILNDITKFNKENINIDMNKLSPLNYDQEQIDNISKEEKKYNDFFKSDSTLLNIAQFYTPDNSLQSDAYKNEQNLENQYKEEMTEIEKQKLQFKNESGDDYNNYIKNLVEDYENNNQNKNEIKREDKGVIGINQDALEYVQQRQENEEKGNLPAHEKDYYDYILNASKGGKKITQKDRLKNLIKN